MMLFRTLFPCLLTGTIFLSCSKSNESRIASFTCGPEPDTTIAILNGRIVERKILPDRTDTLVPLSGAIVTLDQGRKTIHADDVGAFTLYLETKATHPFVISRKGYQPLKVDGFFADKETLAEIKIVLAKGTGERVGKVTPCKIAF